MPRLDYSLHCSSALTNALDAVTRVCCLMRATIPSSLIVTHYFSRYNQRGGT